MKKIVGKLEFFSELGICAAVVRSHDSKGSFDKVLKIQEGDRLVLSHKGEVVFDQEVKPNRELQKKHHSSILIPEGVTYELWQFFIKEEVSAELYTNRQIYF